MKSEVQSIKNTNNIRKRKFANTIELGNKTSEVRVMADSGAYS